MAVKTDGHPEVNPSFLVEQLKQATESFRVTMLAVVTVCTVLAVINASLVGYAVNERTAGLLLAGPVFPLAMMAVVLMVRRMITPMIYTALIIEYRLGGRQDWLGTTYTSVLFGPAYVDRVIEISRIQDRDERMRAVAANPLPFVGTGRGIFRALLVVVTLGQPLATLILWQAYDWAIF